MTKPLYSILMSPVTWLHLSDLHACEPKTGWDARRVLQKLRDDLQRMEREHGLRPDLIFFTGDAAFGEIGSGPGQTIAEQFQAAAEFLEGVRNAFASPVPKENIFIVPGNHDVQRAYVTPDQTAWLARATRDEVLALIQSGTVQWLRFAERLKAYRTFLAGQGYVHLIGNSDHANRLMFAAKRCVNGVEIGIAGLNSAWSCGRDNEKGHLRAAGEWQMATLFPEIENAGIRIMLMHHPPNWLHEHEDPLLARDIERDFSFFLHGHEHQGWVHELATGHVRLAAAACYDRSDLENGYSFVRLDPDAHGGEVWLRRYDRMGGGWTARSIYGKTDDSGRWRFHGRREAGAGAPVTLGQSAELFEELARVYGAGQGAELFLRAIGFPEAKIPANARDAGEFWGSVERLLDSGVLVRGAESIARRAANDYVDNPVFRAFAQTTGARTRC